MKNFFLIFVIIFSSIMIISSFDVSIFASHMGSHHDEMNSKNTPMMGSPGQHGNMMMPGDSHHHMSYNGMCAPGFATLDKICVLDDRCGPGAYPGKICMMNGEMKEYLRPLQQKHSGISVDNIICAEGKSLIFKHYNAAPACVNPESVEKLKNRGWQTDKPPIACTLQYDPVCGVDGITYGNICSLMAQHMAMNYKGECMTTTNSPITNFEECIAAGNPAMESYPRQCRTGDGLHFVEEIEVDVG